MFLNRLAPALTCRARGQGMVLALAVLLLALLSIGPAAAQQDESVVWERFDVTIDVRSDGTMHFTEHQVISFDGRFSQGFAVIPLTRAEDIDNVSVAVANSTSDDPEELDYVRGSRYDADTGTYTYHIESGDLSIDYAFEPTDAFGTSTRVVVLEYDVVGGIRVYEDLDPANQQVWWVPITSDVTDVAPVRASTVTITLPEAVPLEQTVAFPGDSQVSGNSWTWQRTNLGAGEEFEVSLQFPPITAADEPFWQQRDDQVRQALEEQEERSAWAGVLLLAAGLLAAFGGGVALLAAWFTKGRDPGIGMVAEYIPEPPDDLRPGAVGTLLDETFQPRDVVATVLDLGRRGVLRMDPGKEGEGSGSYTFTLIDHKESLRNYERTVLEIIFGPGATAGATREMPDVAGALASRNGDIATGFYQEVVDHGYFRESPERTRKRWAGLFKALPILIGVAVIGIVVVAGAWSNFAFFPIVIGIILMLITGSLARAMPSKTVKGAESAAKWRAFRTYLSQIEKRQDIAESKQIFEKHLPYAVALGLAEEWVSKFAYVRTPSPEWYGGAGPLFGGGRTVIIGDGGPYQRRQRRGGWTMIPGDSGDPWGGGQRQGRGGEGWSIPGMQDVSDSAGRGLQGGSDSFFDMLSTVAKAFGEGAGSGSFGSRGGFGGFSGGGRRGGGSFGGGGGGGRRGFR